MNKIPVIVLSGFLGSGKTTLLLSLIQYTFQRQLKPGILINELGKNDVDGEIVTDGETKIKVEKLLDGCICCNKKSEISASIEQLLLQFPDIIFIELTGVANPEEIADALTEPVLVGKVHLHRIITVLDAENVLEYNNIFASDRELIYTLRRQIEVADQLVVNKTDLISNKEQAKIEKAIRKQNPQAPIEYTTFSKIDLAMIADEAVAAKADRNPTRPNRTKEEEFAQQQQQQHRLSHNTHTHEHKYDHKHDRHPLSFSRLKTTTMMLSDQASLSPKEIERFFKRWKSVLLRAKGYIPLSGEKTLYAKGGLSLVQWAGGRMRIESSPYAGQPYLVLIGLDMEPELIQQDFERLHSERYNGKQV